MSTETKSYGEKRRSGNMMYGPTDMGPKYPHFQLGEARKKFIRVHGAIAGNPTSRIHYDPITYGE